MSEKKKELFSDERWNQPLGGRVIGHREVTEEQKRKVEEYRKQLRKSSK